MKKKYFLIAVALFANFTAFSQQNQPITVIADADFLTNDGVGPQAWGPDITMRAKRIDGSPGIVTMETRFPDDGFGVAGGRFQQIDYYIEYQGEIVNASEQFILEFREPVTDVILQVGQLDKREGKVPRPGRNCNSTERRSFDPVDESGMWTAFDTNGNQIGTGILLEAFSIEGQLPSSRGAFRFALDTNGQPISRLVLEATHWGNGEGCPDYRDGYRDEDGNDSGNTENNSEFNVGALTYTKIGTTPPDEVSINRTVVLLSKQNQLPMQVNRKGNGARVKVEACQDFGQSWRITDLENGYHSIRNRWANRFLAIGSDGLVEGGRIVVKGASDDFGQQWEIIKERFGLYRIKARMADLYLTRASNGQVRLTPLNNRKNQQWKLGNPKTACTTTDLTANSSLFEEVKSTGEIPILQDNVLYLPSNNGYADWKRVVIQDLTGRIVKQVETNFRAIDLTAMLPGVYGVSVERNGNAINYKIIKP